MLLLHHAREDSVDVLEEDLEEDHGVEQLKK
jgi:hypothetical protein